MSLVEIEAELEKLTPEELQQLAVKSWAVFLAKREVRENASECSENDMRLLMALDEAITKADLAPNEGHSGAEVLAHLDRWLTK